MKLVELCKCFKFGQKHPEDGWGAIKVHNAKAGGRATDALGTSNFVGLVVDILKNLYKIKNKKIERLLGI